MDNDSMDVSHGGTGTRPQLMRISSIVELMQEEYKVKAALRRVDSWILRQDSWTRTEQDMLDMQAVATLEAARLEELATLLAKIHSTMPAVYDTARTLYLDMQ